MTDLAHFWGSDLTIATTGDLATIDGSEGTRQRLYRRLLTAPGNYIWQLLYGSGLPGMIGTPITAQQIQGIVSEQTAMEAAVDQTKPITVVVSETTLGAASLSIGYTDAATGQAAGVTLD